MEFRKNSSMKGSLGNFCGWGCMAWYQYEDVVFSSPRFFVMGFLIDKFPVPVNEVLVY